jgi:mannose-1-phosphate guanylyltransferase
MNNVRSKKIINLNNFTTTENNPVDKEKIEMLPNDLREEQYLEVGVRPWGVYYVLESKDHYKVKKIIVTCGARLSLQSHKHRSEHWVVISGNATVEIRSDKDKPETWINDLSPNQSCFIPINTIHRLANYGKIPLVIVEVQVGEYCGEDDITRYSDDYNREVK